MKKIGVLLIVLCAINISFSQVPNLSGTWNGSITNDSGSYKFTLILTLIDSCGPIYRVTQIDGSQESDKCKYNFIQSKNTLLRDAVTFWENINDDSYPGHLKLNYINNKLTGKRVVEITEKNEKGVFNVIKAEKIILTNKKTISYLEPCSINKRPCKEMSPVYIPEEMFFTDTNSIITASILDNSTNDSDVVSVFVGKNKILDEVQIYENVEYTIPIVSKKTTSITWCACNQGLLGKNTGTLILREYKKQTLIKERAIYINLKLNEQTTIFIVKN